jgi:hypothetical protein
VQKHGKMSILIEVHGWKLKILFCDVKLFMVVSI